MVSVLSLLIPIALSAVFVFIASSIIHMATPWHKDDLMKLPDEDGGDERAAAVQAAAGQLRLPASGLDGGHEVAGVPWQRSRPVRSAFMTIRDGWNFSMGGTLFQWFLYSLVVSVFAGYIAGVAFGPGTEYLRIMQVAGCVAFVGYAMAQMHESIWWGRRWSWTIRNMLDWLALRAAHRRHLRLALAALK